VPYIEPDLRKSLDCYELQPPNTGAELNYIVCRLLTRFTEFKGLRYATLAEATSAVQGALDEFKRVVVGPYEENKRQTSEHIWGLLA
jgi:hypothetical protein